MARMTSQMKNKSEKKFLKDKRAEKVAFSNKQKALSKRAIDLSTLCGIDIAIIIFSITAEPFLFGNPNVESVVERFSQAKQPFYNMSSCKTTHEKSEGCGKKDKMKKKEKKATNEEEKGKSTLEIFNPTNLERLEKLMQEIDELEKDLTQKIDELQSEIGAKESKSVLEMNVTNPSAN
ncbi:agamous-like MADS-box protein AGL29 [Nicotiana tomentosiformis]|uniref:agamous-like MADS-box protein AGL29 n=1 Tax=Nicotiana tomentosiformis TaxID=4098 RepID=UPI00051C9E69|nr:agamous-like MADS-box protein AGL29 [Nicotiana tomentosiformis]